MKWTDEQKDVIRLRDRNILVSAAAGSGKTAVLVERIIKRITDETHPVDIDRLLVVTFTKAAAAEMKERISSAVESLMEEHPEDENLKKQQTLIQNAQITTIDSFCLFVVRNHFEEIGLEPNFRIADEGELKLLEKDVLDEVFEKEYQNGTESFLSLVDAYSDKRGNGALKAMVEKIYRQSASSPWPAEWIEDLSKPYLVEAKEELMKTALMQGIFSYAKAVLADFREELVKLRETAAAPDGPQKYVENLDKDIALFEGFEDTKTYDELVAFYQKLQDGMGSLSQIRNYDGDPLKKDAVSNGRNGIKKEIKDISDRYFSLPLEELIGQLKRMKPSVLELVRLALAYLEAVNQRKTEKHILDFSDIEHAALRIFVDEKTKTLRPTAFEFQKQFDEIMIDEYQDSNQVQEEIMRAISREEAGEYNMFMVGDVKQSIYRFRLARPELFMEKFNSYDLTESQRQRIDLHKNFRSRNEVLDFTNDIFYKIMAKDLGNVAYDEKAALNYGADYKPAEDMQAEVLLFEADGEDTMSNRQMEARMIADRILELKKTMQVKDKATGNMRPLKNSDIVILLRGLKNWGSDFVSVLEDYGIAAHVSTSTGYFSATEVQTVLSFLKILDNPYQDIPMAAVLKSAIVGLKDEELAEITIGKDKEVPGFAEAALKQMKEATEGKLYTFYKLFTMLRAKVQDTPIHQLIELIFEETGYGDYVKALPGGAGRRANLDMLVQKAMAYENTSYKGLFHFVRYIDQLQKYEVDFGEADVSGEGEDVVRLMTIHKSKGLEFPVVFVSGIAKQFNTQDSKDKMAIHPDLGLGLDEVLLSPRVKRKCLIRTEIAEQVRRDNLGEELRVLYVAMTRAKEKLILTGVVKSQEKLYDSYTGMIKVGKPLDFHQRVTAKGYIDWIAPAVLSYPEKYSFIFKRAEDFVTATAKHMAEQTLEKDALLQEIVKADETLVEDFKEKFSYKYPYTNDFEKKSKYSVSEIKHASMVENYDRLEGQVEVPKFLLEEREPYVPRFARKEEDTQKEANAGVNMGALRGTAVHRVMECFDFTKLLELENQEYATVKVLLESEIERMRGKRLMTAEMQELIPLGKVTQFLQSDTAQRMAQAAIRGDLYLEKPFVMDYEGALLQGIIDVFWIEDDKIILLDYKTDSVEQASELISRYKKQLELYAQALCKVFSTKERTISETENLIYSFKLNQIIEV